MVGRCSCVGVYSFNATVQISPGDEGRDEVVRKAPRHRPEGGLGLDGPDCSTPKTWGLRTFIGKLWWAAEVRLMRLLLLTLEFAAARGLWWGGGENLVR